MLDASLIDHLIILIMFGCPYFSLQQNRYFDNVDFTVEFLCISSLFCVSFLIKHSFFLYFFNNKLIFLIRTLIILIFLSKIKCFFKKFLIKINDVSMRRQFFVFILYSNRIIKPPIIYPGKSNNRASISDGPLSIASV